MAGRSNRVWSDVMLLSTPCIQVKWIYFAADGDLVPDRRCRADLWHYHGHPLAIDVVEARIIVVSVPKEHSGSPRVHSG